VEGAISRVEVGVCAGDPGGTPIIVPGFAFASQGGGKVKVSDQDEEMPPGYIHHWYTKGHWLEWTVPDAEAGDYDVTLTYSTRYHLRRGLEVNGQPAKGLESFDLGPTGSWGNFARAKLPGKVTLKAGSNVLRLACQDDASMCLSKLTLSLGQCGMKDIVIEGTATSGEGGGKAEKIYAPRGGFFRMWADKGHVLEYVVENAEAGEYEMSLRYGCMYPAKFELKVNGQAAPGLDSFTVPVNGGWQEWVEAPLPAKVKLKAGRNVLQFSPLSGQGLNLSDIRLARAGKPDIFINAATIAREEGGKVWRYSLSRHGFVYAWGTKGQWLEWKVEAPRAGEYQMVLRRANANQATREVQVNGQAVKGLESVVLEPTGGGQAWEETTLPATVKLNQGANTVRMINQGGSISLDEIRLVPAGKP
jgi:hypothetical protein